MLRVIVKMEWKEGGRRDRSEGGCLWREVNLSQLGPVY